MNDNDLSALVAEHVDKRIRCDQCKPLNSQSMMKGDCGHADCIPKGMKIEYATSADAVIPLLEKTKGYEVRWCASYPDATRCEVTVYMPEYHNTNEIRSVTMGAPTFPRAACLALLRAHRVTGF